MIVKNIFVTDQEAFLDALLRELIREEIGYVQIENEVHFLDHIYRFLPVKNSQTMIVRGQEPTERQRVFSSIDVVFCRNRESLDRLISAMDGSSYTATADTFPSLGRENRESKQLRKQLIKSQNRAVNQRLKQIKR